MSGFVSLAQVREQVITSRRDQGLPDHIIAERLLEELAADVLQGGGQ